MDCHCRLNPLINYFIAGEAALAFAAQTVPGSEHHLRRRCGHRMCGRVAAHLPLPCPSRDRRLLRGLPVFAGTRTRQATGDTAGPRVRSLGRRRPGLAARRTRSDTPLDGCGICRRIQLVAKIASRKSLYILEDPVELRERLETGLESSLADPLVRVEQEVLTFSTRTRAR